VALAIILAAAGCAKLEDQGKEAINEAVARAIESKLGPGADAVAGEKKLVVRKDGTEYQVTFPARGEADANAPSQLPLPTGARVTSHIRGIGEDTLIIDADTPLTEMAGFYERELPKAGFEMRRRFANWLQFSGVWAHPSTAVTVSIYGHNANGASRFFLVISYKS